MTVIRKVAWLHIKDRRLLCVRTKGIDIFYNVGGKPDPDETDEEALIREVKEEVSVDLLPKSIKLIKTFRDVFAHDASKRVEIPAYFAEYTGTLAPSSEIEEMAWFNSENRHQLPPAGGQIIDYLAAENLID